MAREDFSELMAALAGGLVSGTQQGMEKKAERQRYEKEQRAKAEQQAFDNELKLIDAADKMQSIEQKKNQNIFMGDLMRALGVKPNTPDQNMNGRVVAGARLGEGKRPATQNTDTGRIQGLFNNKNFDDLDMELTMGPTGPTVKLSPKGSKNARTPGQEDDRTKAVIDLATKAAQREYLERMALEGKYVEGLNNPNQFAPPQELIDANIPYAEDMINRQFGSAKKKREARRGEMLPISLEPKKPRMFDLMVGAGKRLLGGDR
jgi:hypothetical protein